MTRQELFNSIVEDLSSNFREEDRSLLSSIFDEVVDNALFFSNRRFKDEDRQITILASEIRRCTKAIYLQRGAEDVRNTTQSGITSIYEDAFDKLRKDIYRNGKRVMI